MLFLAAEERGKSRKIAWVREFSVFSNRKACPRWGEARTEPGESVVCRGVRLSGSFALSGSQSTSLTMQSAVAHRISR